MTAVTQTFAGIVILAALGTTAVKTVLPSPPPPPPAYIEVHNLSFRDGYVTQERTVQIAPGGSEFWARWDASVVTADGAVICTGGGGNFYTPGYVQRVMSLSEWVGMDCQPPPGEYTITASWHWGDLSTSASAVIEVE
jgi:hypothetical protein